MRACNRRGPAGIIGGRDFDDIAADHVDARQIAQHGRGLPACQSAPDRGAGTGCEGGIERVNVEGDVGGPVADDLLCAGDRPCGALFVHRAGVDIFDTEIVITMGADADLNRAFGVHQPGFHRLVHEGAVVDPVHVIIGPEVGVGIEMYHTHRAILGGIGAQDRQGDEVIAAKSDRARICVQDACDMVGQGLGEGGGFGIVKGDIAVVDDVHVIEGVGGPAIGWVVGLQRACFTDGAGAETGAGAVGDGLVKGDACDGEIDARQVFGVGAAQKGGGPAESVFVGEAALALAGEGSVDFVFGVFHGHGMASVGWGRGVVLGPETPTIRGMGLVPLGGDGSQGW